MKVYLGRWSREHLGRLIDESSKITLAGERVAFLSGHFLHTLYEESTLTGDMSHDEEFVINLAGVDCLTFLEHIEALRLSSSFGEFEERLRGVRYRDGKVSFRSRNHFFTDWRESRIYPRVLLIIPFWTEWNLAIMPAYIQKNPDWMFPMSVLS
jgi:hypothetical protein